MNTIKEFFTVIYTFLKACTNVANETLAWSEEVTAESGMARDELKLDREERQAIINKAREELAKQS